MGYASGVNHVWNQFLLCVPSVGVASITKKSVMYLETTMPLFIVGVSKLSID